MFLDWKAFLEGRGLSLNKILHSLCLPVKKKRQIGIPKRALTLVNSNALPTAVLEGRYKNKTKHMN